MRRASKKPRESDSEEYEKGDVNDYSFEDISTNDITEGDVPGEAKAGGSKDEKKSQQDSPPHVLPRHLGECSKEMEDRHKSITKMQSETLTQLLDLQIQVDALINPTINSEAQKRLLALKIRVEKELNPESFKEECEDAEDAE